MELVKLGKVADFINGKAFKPSDWEDKGKKIIRIQNLNDCSKPYNRTSQNVEDKYLVYPNDILVSWSASLGVFEWKDSEIAVLNQHIFKVVPDEKLICKPYLKYALDKSIDLMLKYTHGSTMKHINRQEFLNIEIPLPPIASQRRIANILDKADEIIRKRKEAIALTEQLQKSIFLDMFGDPVINPKGWEVEELNNVISIISGQVDPKVEPFIDMPHIGGENLQSNTNNIQNIKTPRELKLKSGKYLFQSGNVLYSKIRPYLNQVVITDFSGVCSADIYPLRVIETKIKNDFLIYLLRSKFFLDYAQKHSTRTNIPKINRPTLLSFRFPCPPINIQKDFSDKCNKITQIQKNFNQYLTESENLFNSLLQKAFKGEL
ncbi:restriction endonuclease subunit S [Planktothrix agardhii]|uniref:restriction endonuclease subunit S n=1 Tax=Planktothrix agardhii TaxID=1160 RepID=UPI001D0A38CD|nr:restriction endonuclease subunit S [Planktothrix agardhii]MCB8749710.1 restriction endonuclease subunit S [Planktothrix agardhii 1810]